MTRGFDRRLSALPLAAADSIRAASRAHRREPQASRHPPPPTIADSDVAPYQDSKSPASLALSASSPLDSTPNFVKMFERCVLAVRAEMPSAAPISLFDRRAATSRP